MIFLDSIEEVSKRYETAGSRPLRVLASDLEYYICKYPFHPNDPKLLNEYLGFHFARLWDIKVPDLGIVKLKREHLPLETLGMQLSYQSIVKPLVGLKQIPDAIEIIDSISGGISKTDLKKYNRKDFLAIALFDIWLSNEDRNCGNMNLLVNMSNDVISPIAIDHEKIFNSGSLFGQISSLTYQDSLFYSNLFHMLFRSRNRKNLILFDEIGASLQNKSSICHDNLGSIVEGIPEEWGYEKDEIYDKLSGWLFSPSWISEVERTYREFISLMTPNI
ncbi:hypothetical protein MMU07_08995 [Aquiflexum sp. LQ15W]|uniref:HipA family kinase n=1 Tax=Cognataquiflexum nitidum TaxID=2922272 RepID=UPI001F13D415|nr:HipA family kinase [Cognataquiflexum nitidum]MCH6199715.1 hypothetical protein [Cognataquiflexum nitidum]